MTAKFLIPTHARRFFEYHCNESHDSAHAELWYRSQVEVTVLCIENMGPEHRNSTRRSRGENGIPLVYKIRFADGFEHTAFEDELLSSPAHYCRPNPPPRPK